MIVIMLLNMNQAQIREALCLKDIIAAALKKDAYFDGKIMIIIENETIKIVVEPFGDGLIEYR